MQEYRFKFYLNAMHSILIGEIMGEVHPHTWEIVVDVFKQNNGFIAFTEVEKPIDALLRPFQNKNMNTIPPFDAINPTLENVTTYLQNELETMFVANGFIMTRIEVSETPSRTFVIDIRNSDYNDGPEDTSAIFNSEIAQEESDKLLQQKLLEVTTGITEDAFAGTNSLNYSYRRFANRRKVKKGIDKILYLIAPALIIGAAAYFIFLR